MKTWQKRSIIAAGAAAGVFIVLLLAAGWYFADLLYDRALSPKTRDPGVSVRIISAGPSVVTLSPLTPWNDVYRHAGLFDLSWAGGKIGIPADRRPPGRLQTPETSLSGSVGRGLISDILTIDGSRITRTFNLTEGEGPQPGTEGIIDEILQARDSYVVPGFDAEQGFYTSEAGSFACWKTPGTARTTVILVHGNGMRVADVRRMASSFRSLGYPTMAITFRNDPGQPRDPSGMLQYGRTEWKDLEGAVRSALDGGSDGVVLFGMSMGGGIALSFMYNSPLAVRVKGLVLDAPMLDFGRAVDLNAEAERLPGLGLPVPRLLVSTAKLITSLRFGIRWRDIDYLSKADSLRAPILLFHGTRDTTIPVAASDELAARRRDLVFNYIRIDGVEHVESWNHDPSAYERRLGEFLSFVEGTSGARLAIIPAVSSGRASDSAP
jgi:uncharacterized protein